MNWYAKKNPDPTPEEIQERAAIIRADRAMNNEIGMQGHKNNVPINKLREVAVRRKPLRDLIGERIAAHDNKLQERESHEELESEEPQHLVPENWRP